MVGTTLGSRWWVAECGYLSGGGGAEVAGGKGRRQRPYKRESDGQLQETQMQGWGKQREVAEGAEWVPARR